MCKRSAVTIFSLTLCVGALGCFEWRGALDAGRSGGHQRHEHDVPAAGGDGHAADGGATGYDACTPIDLFARCEPGRLPSRMPTPRFNLSGAVAPDGRIYLVGGDREFSGGAPEPGPLALYDPVDDSYYALAAAPERFLGIPGAAFAAGKLVVTDGAAWIYDPAANDWTAAAEPPQRLRNQTAVVCGEGRICFFGGYGSEGPVASAVAYDVASDAWTVLPSMSFVGEGLVVGRSGRSIYVVGLSAAVFDLETEHWSEIAPPPTPRYWAMGGVDSSGRIVTFGGVPPGAIGVAGPTEIYDPQTDTWTAGAGIDAYFTQGASVTACSGEIFVFGGDYAASISDQVRVFTLGSTWHSSP